MNLRSKQRHLLHLQSQRRINLLNSKRCASWSQAMQERKERKERKERWLWHHQKRQRNVSFALKQKVLLLLLLV